MTQSAVAQTNGAGRASWPSVTIVFLVFNRRDELRESLRRMLYESDYERELVDVIVVDNASSDGSAAMVREEFPDVRVIELPRNVGVSGSNAGFAAARGDFVLSLDDDCYLPPDGLRHAISAALAERADMVSFKAVSTRDPAWVFTDKYRTGLFMFWGCAVLLRREVIEALGGYDPAIFVWANELEFTMRLFDRGFRHLHHPGIVAQHMKPPDTPGRSYIGPRNYRYNHRHWGYIAAKLMQPRDALEALVALLATAIRDGMRVDRVAFTAIPQALRGFARGLRRRTPVRAEVSRFYRHNFESFASPWWISRRPGELLRALPRELVFGRSDERYMDRKEEFLAERRRYYPEDAAALDFATEQVPGRAPADS